MGVGHLGTRFWDVHAIMEAEHSAWSTEVLAALTPHGGDLGEPVDFFAQAWWDVLDEREAEAST